MRACLAVAFGALLVPAFPAVPLAATSTTAWSDSAALLRIESARALRRAGRRDSALAVLNPLLEPAVRIQFAPRTRVELYRAGNMMCVYAGDARRAVELGREGIPVAAALRDTAAEISMNLFNATALRQLGRFDEGRAAAQRGLLLSRRRDDAPGQVTALNELANLSDMRGRRGEARGHYAEAYRIGMAARDSARTPIFLANIGRGFSAEGQTDSARHYLTRALRLAEQARQPRAVALASQHLATLEVIYGDPSRALEHYERAGSVLRTQGSAIDQLGTDEDRAETLFWLGRHDEARALADSLRVVAARLGQPSIATGAAILIGQIELAEGRPAGAAASARRALAAAPDDRHRVNATTLLVRALIELDSLESARREIVAIRMTAGGAALPRHAVLLDAQEVEILSLSGRHEEAIAAAQQAETRARKLGELVPTLDAMTARARSERALGRPKEAIRTLDRALAHWEEKRRQASDPEWRERLTASARHVVAERLTLELETSPHDDAALRALAVVERYKARTTMERVLEPGGDAPARPSSSFDVAEWRRAALGPDDLFLETFAARDTTWIFAVTDQTIRLYGVGPLGGALGRRIQRLRNAAAMRPQSSEEAAALSASAAAIGRELLHPIADLLATHHRLLVSPDDRLALAPFGMLSAGGEPLVATHTLAQVPSAAALPQLRRRAGQRMTPPASLLAFAGPRPDDGRPLPGAQAEVASIRRVGTRAEVVQGPTPSARVPLARYDALHFAAHAVASDQAPWSSGILFDRPDQDDPDPYLRASRVAGMRLDARLAVLSGCETAGGAVVQGEGLLGLSGAFLAAGVPAVVASLWKVDDRSVVRFMERFYESLAAGANTAAALRDAQNATRGDAETAHPYHWAGFVVHGTPDVTLMLRAGR